MKGRHGDAYPKSQHLGGRGKWISEFEASLVYTESSRTAREKTILKSLKKKKKPQPLNIGAESCEKSSNCVRLTHT